MEDSLVLYICAVSLGDGLTGSRKFKMRGVEVDENKFYRRVCKFFAQTTLKTVASWVAQLNNLVEEQPYPALVHLPSSYLDCFISVNPNPEEHTHQPVLIMAFRGPYANSVWQEITGPSDFQLARRTDPASINALYLDSQDQPLLYSPRLANRFSLLGLQRVQLSRKQAQSLGLTTRQVATFCHAPTVSLDGEQVELSSHCLVLLMRRESTVRYSSRLPIGLMNELVVEGLIGSIQARFTEAVGPEVCFYTIPYSKNHHNILGGHMWTIPESSHMVLSKHAYPSCPDAEQVVILTLTGQNIMENEIKFLHKVLRRDPAGHEGFELLALKWVSQLSRRQAQELSPFEIGEREWQSSVQSLTSTPALILALRRVRAFNSLRQQLQHNYPGTLHVLMSPTPETAFRQTCLFFSESELVPDHSSRPFLKFLPPYHIDTSGHLLYSYMTLGPEPLLTLALFKPGAWRHCFGKILTLIKQNGYTLVGLRVLLLDSRMANALIHSPEKQDPTEELEYLRSGPSLALGLLRENAVMRLWELMGPEDPIEARTVDQTLWRAQFGSDRLHNGIYGSQSYRKAVEDIKLVFPRGVCCAETSLMRYEQISSLYSDPEASSDCDHSHSLRTAVKFSSEFGQGNLRSTFVMRMGTVVVYCVSVPAGPLVCTALYQTTCLLIPSSLLQQSQPPLFSELLQRLLRTGCHLLEGRLCMLGEKQRRHVCELLRASAGEELLCEGPCLAIVLQADNAVTCFDIILERICRERPDFWRVTREFLYPRFKKEAVKLLCYLFDDLGLDSHHHVA
ncbi:dynein axonemal assembly factor 8 [Danio aesculapii]|uniref:dynein axonemal assembly factor 8 n=1 Tax=Danio aesculapii TaxID=1142201 RepID=UPI0024C02E2B|nr:dynein axonemal assembly factor 8 [Danio aesculapii]